jgi:hypothetical protein
MLATYADEQTPQASARSVGAIPMEYRRSVMTMLKRFSGFFIAALMVSALGCASTSKSSSTGEYFDDSLITTKVKTAIFNEPSLKVNQIHRRDLQERGSVERFSWIPRQHGQGGHDRALGAGRELGEERHAAQVSIL